MFRRCVRDSRAGSDDKECASWIFGFFALLPNPGLLAKAGVIIDHLSGGRADIGSGTGWFEEEFRDFGYRFPSRSERFAQLEEA